MFSLHIILLSAFCSFLQIALPPAPNKLVSDFAGILSSQEVGMLEKKLVAFDDSTSNQIAIVILQNTQGDDIANVATELGRKWGIGTKSNNNGVLILMSKDDKKVFIAPGYGLEGALPDLLAKRMIDEFFIPFAKKENFYQAFDLITDAVIQAVQGEYKEKSSNKKGKGSRSAFFFLLLVIVICIILFNRKGGGGRNNRGGSGLLWATPLMIGGSRGGFGGGSGFGGGGFGGFGGGSFGGGGAGGSW